MRELNLSYTTCFLHEPVADYLYCIPLSLVDLRLTGTQVYNTQILINALTRLINLEHLRINGLATITDTSLDSVSEARTRRVYPYLVPSSLVDSQCHRTSIENNRNEWVHHRWLID